MRASNCASLAFAKPVPRLLERRAAKAELDRIDREQRKRCKLRSGGRCEVVLVTHKPETSSVSQARCKHKAEENHHLLGGNGRRNVGISVLAEHRIDICRKHHQEINAAMIEPYAIDESRDAATVRYIAVER